MSRKSSHSALVTRTDSISNATAWHRRLGHLHPDGVISFLQHTKRPPISRQEFIGCDDCAQGKSTQSPATSPFWRSPNALDLVHSDLLGPISPPTSSGKKYILSFIDDHTRFNHIYLLSSKDETFTCFKKYKALVEKQTGRRIGKLKSDRGGEYSSTAFLQFLEEAGIQLERGPAQRPPPTPWRRGSFAQSWVASVPSFSNLASPPSSGVSWLLTAACISTAALQGHSTCTYPCWNTRKLSLDTSTPSISHDYSHLVAERLPTSNTGPLSSKPPQRA